MSAKKVVTLVLCMVLVAALSVVGTLAYLTDTSKVTNTFTAGNVDIKLEETEVDREGTVIGALRESGNVYHLIPGHEYTKDPTVTVLEPSDTCYVRMMVTVTIPNGIDATTAAMPLDEMFPDYDESVWPRASKTIDGNTITYEYRYKTTVNAEDTTAKDDSVKLEPLFTTIQVPTDWDNAQLDALEGMTVDVTAQAIQADGFTVDQAWIAFDGQNNP